MATKAQYETEDSVSKEPKDKSFGERIFKKFEHPPKIRPSFSLSPLDIAYKIYKYKTGKFPLENAVSDLEYRLNPRIDTGSVPVGTQFNPSDFDSSELDKGGAAKKYAKGGYVKSADGIAQRGKTKGRMC